MAIETSPEEATLFDDIGNFAKSLWEKSRKVEGPFTDPRMISIMLFRRLWSNHRGYALLWKNGFSLEADIILRSGIEASICIAANEAKRGEFVELLRRDACATVKGQITMLRDDGDDDRAREAEAVLQDMLSKRPDDYRPDRLRWKDLAEAGGVPKLYGWYRQLSGMSSHVTGASILRGIEFADGVTPGGNVPAIERKMHLMMMAGATLEGSRRHAAMLKDEEEYGNAVDLLNRLAELSKQWPRAVKDV